MSTWRVACAPSNRCCRGRAAAWEEGRQEGRQEGAKVTPRVVPARTWQVNIPLTAPLWLRWYQPAALERT